MLLRVVNDEIILVQENAEVVDVDGRHYTASDLKYLSDYKLEKFLSIYRVDPIAVPAHMELDGEVSFFLDSKKKPHPTYRLRPKPEPIPEVSEAIVTPELAAQLESIADAGIPADPEIKKLKAKLIHTDAEVSTLVAFGGIAFRTLTLKKKGDFHQGHRHHYDHITNVVRGRVLCEVDGGTPKVYKVGDQITIRKDDWHKFTAMEDDTMYQCVYRQPDSEIMDVYTGENSPYGEVPYTPQEIEERIKSMKNPCAHCDCER